MARFEVDVKIIVEADDDSEAYHVAASAAENLVCGSIIEVEMGGVADLSMADNS